MRKLVVLGAAVAAFAFGCASMSHPVPSGTFHCTEFNQSCMDGYNRLRRDLCTKGVERVKITEALDVYNGNPVLPYHEVQRITNVYDCPAVTR